MPSYAQLEAEPWWGREIVTVELDWLGDELCARTGRPRSSAGTKGNNLHLNGGHRSQEWILNSDYCTNTSYTVQSGLTSEQLRHIAALDFTPGAWGTSSNRALMAAQTKRLWDAAKRGELTGVRQIQGTLDGVRAAGLNVVSGSTMTPDSSHLDHWHLTFDRKHMRDRALMARIVNIALGTTGGEMYAAQSDTVSHAAMYAQEQLLFVVQAVPELTKRLAENPLTVDGKYGPRTAYWVSVIVTGGPGSEMTGRDFARLDQMVIDYKIMAAGVGQGPAGPQGPPGPEGPQGPKGDAAVLAAGTELRVVAP